MQPKEYLSSGRGVADSNSSIREALTTILRESAADAHRALSEIPVRKDPDKPRTKAWRRSCGSHLIPPPHIPGSAGRAQAAAHGLVYAAPEESCFFIPGALRTLGLCGPFPLNGILDAHLIRYSVFLMLSGSCFLI